MADFKKAYLKLTKAEFSNRPEKFLHKNSGESDITLGGIYRKANPESFDWEFIDKIIKACFYDYERASILLYNDSNTKESVFNFFRTHYWDKIRLDEVQNQNTAEEIFLMGVVTHPRTAIRLAQKLILVNPDGICGKYTLKALNNYNADMFDRQYDNFEMKHFDFIIEQNPDLSINREGWYSRSILVGTSLFIVGLSDILVQF